MKAIELPPRVEGGILALSVIGMAILQLLSHGYRPPDDVLRHAAFAVGNRPWNQILLGRPEALFDQAPGWHALLRGLHGGFGVGPDGLVVFSIAFALALFLASGLLIVRRWEAWALALSMCFFLDSPLLVRMSLGRPLVITAALVVVLMGTIRRPEARPWRHPTHLLWCLGAAVATWVHGSWYLLLLLPGSVLLAGRIGEGLRLGACVLVGCCLGAALTGTPAAFLHGQFAHLVHALGRHADPRSLVTEFTPGGQTWWLPVMVLGAGLVNRRNLDASRLRKDALLLLGAFTWLLGYFYVWRFYLDWAFPALALWVALQFEEAALGVAVSGWRRAVVTGVVAACFFSVIATNHHGRWSVKGTQNGLVAHTPEEQILLPEPGGVLYSNSLAMFFGTFFQHPNGPWKYALGYEPGLMEPADDQVFQATFRPRNRDQALAPWAARMTERDRMVLFGKPRKPPAIPGLTWRFSAPNKWVGMKPR